jgi:hypothetical protein
MRYLSDKYGFRV